MLEVTNRRILIACLDWGKGHVSRSIGIIHKLLEQQNRVTIACNDSQRLIFADYFPEITFVNLSGYNFSFRGKGNFFKDLWQFRKSFFKAVEQEHIFVEQLITQEQFDLIISDHRYGFYSNQVESIFLTHQLNLPLSKFAFPVHLFHKRQLKHFSKIWILDDEKLSLSGKMGVNNANWSIDYIGHFSRFMFQENPKVKTGKPVLICNGPRPYDEQLLSKFSAILSKVQIIAPAHIELNFPNLDIITADNWLKCDEAILNAPKLYAYCGYTTLMDLKFLRCESELIPTPGQVEQRYLFSRIQK